MSDIESDIQQLEPGPIMEFWELDGSAIGAGVLRFQGQQDGKVWWQGVDYDGWPINAEGFARTSDQQPNPKLRVGNIDRSITILCQLFDDMVGAKLTRRRTFAKYIDAINFLGPNLVPGDGTFDDPALISQFTILGTPSISGGKLRIGNTSTVDAVSLVATTVPGKQYKLTFYNDAGGNSVNWRIGTSINGSQIAGTFVQGAGGGIDYTFTATTATTYVQWYRTPTSAVQALVDNVVLRSIEGNPDADPAKEFPLEVWFIERKASESMDVVEFDMSSALDFMGVKLPRRQIIANQCPFVYRGPLCGYTGGPVADELDQPTSNPLLDKCGHRLASCKLRDWPDDVLNYGGFPAAGLVRT